MDNVNEKWSGDTEIKSTGKWADKTIAELKKARSALKTRKIELKKKLLSYVKLTLLYDLRKIGKAE